MRAAVARIYHTSSMDAGGGATTPSNRSDLWMPCWWKKRVVRAITKLTKILIAHEGDVSLAQWASIK